MLILSGLVIVSKHFQRAELGIIKLIIQIQIQHGLF